MMAAKLAQMRARGRKLQQEERPAWNDAWNWNRKHPAGLPPVGTTGRKLRQETPTPLGSDAWVVRDKLRPGLARKLQQEERPAWNDAWNWNRKHPAGLPPVGTGRKLRQDDDPI